MPRATTSEHERTHVGAGALQPPVAVAHASAGDVNGGSASPPPELPSYEPADTPSPAHDDEGAPDDDGPPEEDESDESETDDDDDESDSGAPDGAAAAADNAAATSASAPAPATASAPPPSNGADAMAVDTPAPPTTASPAAQPAAPVNQLTAKPKAKRKARTPSPSPPPMPVAPPLRTLRLTLPLGGPERYEVDVAAAAVAAGQRAPSPPPPEALLAREAPMPETETEGEGKGKKTRKRRKNLEYYDLGDPFIDDSDLALDQRTYIAQTKQAGFYVSSGEVALLKDRAAPASAAPVSNDGGGGGGGGGGGRGRKSAAHLPSPEPLAGPSSFPGSAHAPLHTQLVKSKEQKEKEARERAERRHTVGGEGAAGSRDAPIAVSDEDMAGGTAPANGAKRKGGPGADGARKRRKVDMDAFHPELRAAVDGLRVAKEKESWANKGRFPPGLKPLLAAAALKAIRVNQYDDNFFNCMPDIFPYNRFTMSKLIKRLVFNDHMALLVERQDEILADLKALADEHFDKAQEEWERSYRAWQTRMEKAGLPTDGSAAPAPADGDGAEGGTAAQAAPAKRYKLTEKMKGKIWSLVCLSNEACRIENEKSTLEGTGAQVSEQGLRKALYQKIVAAFPEGWMNSGQISRDVSVIKKKFETAMKEDD